MKEVKLKKVGHNYEWWIVILLALLFGMVQFDRNAILWMMPVIAPELKLTMAAVGSIAAVLALCWAVSGWVLGHVSDIRGRRILIIPMGFLFSAMSWVSGVARNFVQMMIIRGIMGIGEGTTYSSSAGLIAEESTPARRGLNLGLHQCIAALIGFGVGAVIATQLAAIYGWRWTFFIVGIPGIILCLILVWYMREPLSTLKFAAARRAIKRGDTTVEAIEAPPPIWRSVASTLLYRNVVVAAIISCFAMTGVWVYMAFGTLYLTQVLKFSLPAAGFMMMFYGLGAFVGTIGLGSVSDRIGRKPTVIASFLLGSISFFLSIFVAGNSQAAICSCFFFGGLFALGIYPVFMATVPAESVPLGLQAAAIGTVVAIGEIFGSVAMPPLSGWLADIFGLQVTMVIAASAMIVAGLIAFAYLETAPAILQRKGITLTEEDHLLMKKPAA